MNVKVKKVTDQATHVPYFFKVELFENNIDFEGSTFNVSVTDGARCWRKEGN
jgi:hypothetical protein